VFEVGAIFLEVAQTAGLGADEVPVELAVGELVAIPAFDNVEPQLMPARNCGFSILTMTGPLENTHWSFNSP